MAMNDEDDAWFAPKRYGYGVGLPIAWQGWALLSGYMAIAGLAVLLMAWDAEVGLPAGAIILAIATAALIVVSKLKTRDGWHWRWGERD